MEIVITWKEGRAHAKIQEIPDAEANGRSEAEAIGNLVATNSDRLTVPLTICYAA